MAVIWQIWRELWSMFVDDGAMAAQVVAMVAMLAVAALILSPLWAAFLLLPGCLVLLAASVLRAKPKSGPH